MPTMIPTTGLRIVLRDEPVPGYPTIITKKPVLQQRLEYTTGGHVWVDVPIVEEGA